MQTAKLVGTAFKLVASSPSAASTSSPSSADLLPGGFRRIRRKRTGAKKKVDNLLKEKIEELSGVIPFSFEPSKPPSTEIQNKNKRSAVGVTGRIFLLTLLCNNLHY